MNTEKTKTYFDIEIPTKGVYALCYVLGWVSGLVFYFMEDDKEIRYHALHSIAVFGLISVIMSVFPIPFLGLLSFFVWVMLIAKAYKGEKVDFPIITDVIKRNFLK